MGELIGKAMEGKLHYIDKNEFDRVYQLNTGTPQSRCAVFADMCRLNTLHMIGRAGSGHIGSSFSSMDIIAWLYLHELRGDDLYFSSKGHDAPGLYSLLIALGRLPQDNLHALRRIDGLPGHPDVSVPGMVVNSGSLGQGISKAKGMVRADRLDNRKRRIFVLTGDGELQEGQIWESLVSAANDKMGEVVVIVDHNKLQSDYLLNQTSDLGDLDAKFASFGWHVERIDGHDLMAFEEAISRCASVADKPQVIIADTIKGRGVSFMEHTAMESDAEQYRFHSGAPDSDSYRKALDELIARINKGLNELATGEISLETVNRTNPPAPEKTQRLIPAYTEALLAQSRKNRNIVALDADLILDTGLMPFRDEFSDRFYECGIAEQDMVSQAGGLALQGKLPICHSFACFLGPRANEQIYTNSTEATKIVYVGSLAGVLPGGPGHSHQSVRDISALGGMPNFTMVEPCCEKEVAPLLDFCLNGTQGSSYIRLVSIPCQIPYELPSDYTVSEGRGIQLREGTDAVMIGYGPVLLSEAYRALEQLEERGGPKVALYALPWLNRIDAGWLDGICAHVNTVFTLDNHYLKGGQGEMIACALSECAGTKNPRIVRFGLDGVPVSGTNPEVLAHHQLDAESLEKAVETQLA